MGVIRFILAFAVVIFHSGGTFLGVQMIPGYICVELFFIISGFYMEFILSNSYNRKRDFYLSRFIRLWPLFFLVAVCYLLFETGFTLLEHKPYNVARARVYNDFNPWLRIAAFFSNVFMVGQDILSWFYIGPNGTIQFFRGSFLEGIDSSGYTWGGNLRLNGPAWSIGLEIWFYLLVPFLQKFKSRYLVAFLLASAGLRIYLGPVIGVHTYFFFPTQFYLFLIGMLAFRYKELLSFNRWYALLLYIFLLAGIIGYAYLPVNKDLLRYVVLPLLLFAGINSMFYSFLKVKWDRFIGDLSYPIYILHSFIILSVSKLIDYMAFPVSANAMHWLLYAVIILLSTLWVRKAEKLINRYRWKLTKKYA